MNKGFSLIELVISVLIIGLLAAAISFGSSIYDQVILRSIVADMKKYQSAYLSFKDIYKMPPGDFDQADAIWGANCADTISCNGDGNGTIDASATPASETHKAWKHLELAGFLSANIGVVPSNWDGHLLLENAPKSRMQNAGFFTASGNIGTDSSFIASPFLSNNNRENNAIFIGAESASASFVVGVITPLEAYNLDNKFDDGKMNSSGIASGNSTGMIRVIDGQNGLSQCISGGYYNVTNSAKSCLLGHILDEGDYE